MLRINITTWPIRLEYNINNAQLNLRTTKPQVKIKTTPPLLEIRQPSGELTIDSYPCRYAIGLKNIADFARDNAILGKQIALETIGRIAQEGDQMAQIQNKTNAIADIAFSHTITEAPDITYARIPLPNIHYQANPVQLNFTKGKVDLTLQRGTVQGDYQPGSVDIRVIRYPRIEISTVDVKV